MPNTEDMSVGEITERLFEDIHTAHMRGIHFSDTQIRATLFDYGIPIPIHTRAVNTLVANHSEDLIHFGYTPVYHPENGRSAWYELQHKRRH